MTTRAKSPEAEPEPDAPEEPEAPEESDAHKAFMRGEMTWREMCEAGG